MEIVAKIFDWEITRTELDFELTRVEKLYPEAYSAEIKTFAIENLVDRYLLLHEALNHGITISDEEFELALLEMCDLVDAPGTAVLVNREGREQQIERILKSNLIIHKFIHTHDICQKEITEDMLYKFYQEHHDFFCQKEEVRTSHILIKSHDEAARQRIQQIRDSIRTTQDFTDFSMCDSQCPSGVKCGDLGFFPRGRMIPEIEKVAFKLNVNDISQPFHTKFGYHILMVTDRKTKHTIPFEQIRDDLRESLKEFEEEIARSRILAEIRERDKDAVRIFDNAFK